MAARKLRQPLLPEEPAGPTSDEPPGTESDDSAAPPRGRLVLAAVVFGIWFVALVMLAILSANPLTLNREQIRRADLVVEARVLPGATDQCEVVATWPAGDVGQTITVRGLAELSAEVGQAYLMPLARDEHTGSYSVVVSGPPVSARLIYPAGEQSRRQLSEILAKR